VERADIFAAVEEIERHVNLDSYIELNVFDLNGENGSIRINKSDLPPGYLGIATWRFSQGEVVSCDIKVKEHALAEDVLIHELLHCAGIAQHDDPVVYPESIMRGCVGLHRTILSKHALHLLFCTECVNDCFDGDFYEEVFGEDAILHEDLR
jgi:hypothetical protein